MHGPAVGVDVGGTFTDCIIVDPRDQTIRVSKVSSTTEDQSIGLVAAVNQAWTDGDWPFSTFVHGTTVATNAVLQRRGSPVALITTRGFRDVLEMRRRDRPDLYGLTGQYRPIVRRGSVFEVTERMDRDGVVETPLDEAELADLARRLAGDVYETVVVSFLNAYANPAAELRAAEILRSKLPPTVGVIAATSVTREYREFERTSTAVVSAYVQPFIGRYLRALDERVRSGGYENDIWIVQSNGGRMSLDVAAERSVNTILSGPAAGVVAGRQVGERAGFENVVTMDMGGTSLDVGVVLNGKIAMSAETAIEFGVPLRLPMVDVHTIGAGGGSIAHINREGLLAIGPQSAGALPGPACYGRGGLEPTLTDANVALHRIGAEQRLGSGASSLRVDRELSLQALARLRPAVDGTAEAVAQSVVDIAVHTIADAIRLVTVERGLDPREFVLVAFGGAGALHVCDVMKAVGFQVAIIPRFPGITSALGCVIGDVRHDFVQTVDEPLDRLREEALTEIIDAHREAAQQLFEREGVDPDAVVVHVEADMNYDRQTHSIPVPLPADDVSLGSLKISFEETYSRRFGRLFSDATIRLVNVRTTLTAPGTTVSVGAYSIVSAKGSAGDRTTPDAQRRIVYFDGEPLECLVQQRSNLTVGNVIVGPAIVDQDDATCVIDPGFHASVDENLNLVVRVGAPS